MANTKFGIINLTYCHWQYSFLMLFIFKYHAAYVAPIVKSQVESPAI